MQQGPYANPSVWSLALD